MTGPAGISGGRLGHAFVALPPMTADDHDRPAEDLPSAADLAGWTLAAQHPLTREWDDDEARIARLADDHEFDLRLATDLDLATQRALLAPGHAPAELLNRWLAVAPDLRAMLSIRFEGGDASMPFVDASALSRPLAEGDLPALGAAALQVFGSFSPRYLRLWSAAPTDAYAGTARDKRFLAAPLDELANHAGTSASAAELSLAPTPDLSQWDAAVAAYAAVDADHPGHREQAGIQGKDDLAESVDAGTLFDVLVDGEWAGWVGATTDTSSSLGLAAYEVLEIILAPGFRGRGYGAHLTTLLAGRLPQRDRVLIGTIHADNRGAMEAAARAGRYDVGGWLQLPLPLQ